jgi:hypothetical protein
MKRGEDHPPVKDVDGRVYIEDGRGGWVPEDDPTATAMTWRALTQQVPDGELHVDHSKDNQ